MVKKRLFSLLPTTAAGSKGRFNFSALILLVDPVPSLTAKADETTNELQKPTATAVPFIRRPCGVLQQRTRHIQWRWKSGRSLKDIKICTGIVEYRFGMNRESSWEFELETDTESLP